MPAEDIQQVTDAEFETAVLRSETPVLVDFWAPWCGPCQMQAPVLDEIARDLAGKMTVAKLNVDDNGKTAQDYGVMAIPTLILFKGGEVKEKAVGFMTRAKLEALVLKHIQP